MWGTGRSHIKAHTFRIVQQYLVVWTLTPHTQGFMARWALGPSQGLRKAHMSQTLAEAAELRLTSGTPWTARPSPPGGDPSGSWAAWARPRAARAAPGSPAGA